MATSTFNMVVGRGGRSLTEKWQTDGTRRSSACTAAGFPNLFIMTGPQGGGGSFNFTDAIDTHADYVVWMLSTMRDTATKSSTSTQDARGGVRRALPRSRHRHRPAADCLSYYNGHGEAEPAAWRTTAAALAQLAQARPGLDRSVRVR